MASRITTEFDLVTSAGGNLGSISRTLTRMGVPFRLVGNDDPPGGSRPIILPGVGAFGAVMNSLKVNQFDQTIVKLVRSGTPFLGVCVGLQVLFDQSEEAPGVAGLGLIPGKVLKFRQGKVPQIGWNFIEPVNDSRWEKGYVYFVNSYYAKPDSEDVILYRSDYYESFCAAVKTGNVTAFQFHPEKSGEFGERLLRKWINDVS
ncbi:MAG: imidazole glycerol phosphate synthase subunit HisH [Cyanobacteria bacterium SZAS LIN-5]|nr:imidazole glycerol phosphate synthase subunit HisH [Cyanobacteria bacterium SZAS LIN-5]